MATAAMICDDLAINKINPYTWSGTYGVNTDGFPNTLEIDGSWTTQIDETPTEYPVMPDEANFQNSDFSGSMYLKTAEVDPAPYRMFPARKMEFSDGTVTWYRPGMPWSAARASADYPQLGGATYFKDNSLMIIIVILVLIYVLFSKKK